MSNKLLVISARNLIKALHKIGYDVDHQTGSHIILRNTKYPHRRLSVPNHKEIARGTLRAIIKQSGIDPRQFLNML